MKIRIRHTTAFRYARPVVFEEHRLMLLPRGSHELTILESRLHCSPEAKVDWALDVFGNVVATAHFAEPGSHLILASEVLVDQSAAPWPIFSIAPQAHSYPFRYTEADRVDLGALLQPQYGDDEGSLKKWAEAFVYSTPTDTLSLLKDINAGIVAKIVYRVREEEGTQTPAETLDLGSGSCRDIAALFIETVRMLGFGARAVSGYLLETAAAGDGSAHAWAEVYLPGAGWITFDPTNRRVGSACLIPIAVGRCNQQIMPVSGSYAGAPGDFLGSEVTVDLALLDDDPGSTIAANSAS